MPEALLAGICLALLLAHIASTAVAMFRCRPQRQLMPPPAVPPKVAVLRPVCGVDTFDESTLRSTFQLDYSRTQLIFCCDRANDAAAHVVRALIKEFPHVDAKLLIGRDPVTCNPKLNNLLKGWPHVDAEWLIMADSNVEMPKDYVQRLLAGWKTGTGVLCSPPIGKSPVGFWAEIECAFLNTYQARWQYTADSVGWGFAQGKTMMFRRRDLAAAGWAVGPGGRGGRGRGRDKAGACHGAERPPHRPSVRAAPRTALGAPSLGSSGAVGEAATHDLPIPVPSRNPDDQRRTADGGRACQ